MRSPCVGAPPFESSNVAGPSGHGFAHCETAVDYALAVTVGRNSQLNKDRGVIAKIGIVISRSGRTFRDIT